MRIVYKRSLFFLGVLIVLIACIGVGYLFYDRVLQNETLVVVDDELSINFMAGDTIITNGEYRFSVTNSGSNDVYYQIHLNNIQGFQSGITYELLSDDVQVSTSSTTLENGDNAVMDQILIAPSETQNFRLRVDNNTSTTFKIDVEKVVEVEEYFYMTLLSQNEVKEEADTNVGVDVSTSDEGLIEERDGDGTVYYFRGNVENNYVSFAGLTWRIIRINADGTVRLILNSTTDTLSTYHDSTDGYEDLEETDIYASLNQYYTNHLSNYESYIANTRFCKESGRTGDTYNAYTRIITNQIPTLHCLGEQYISRIGLITADEVIYAGGLYDTENTSYYLYQEEIENYWWTSSLASVDGDVFYPFVVSDEGALENETSGSLYRGVRPVISLNRNVTVSGSGTSDDPYTVN